MSKSEPKVELEESNPQPVSSKPPPGDLGPKPSRVPDGICSPESKVHRFRADYTWEGVEIKPYKTKQRDWADGVRQVIIGAGGEHTNFHLRYFELAPGGYTSLERHEHAHVVIAVRGSGRVIAGDQRWDLNFLDIAYIAPYSPHQLLNPSPQPFGFLCIVDAVRDRPQPLSQEEIEHVAHRIDSQNTDDTDQTHSHG